MEKLIFWSIIDWLYYQNAVFGVGHILFRSRVYWLDSKSDRDDLFKVFQEENS
jgi:hypothetical protein